MRSHCPTGCAPSPPLQLPCQAPMSVAASCVAPPTAFEMPSCSSCGSGSPWLACTVLAALQPKYVTACRRRRELISPPIAVLPIHRQRRNARSTVLCDGLASAAVAQLVARRSHNPKVLSSILTGRIVCSVETPAPPVSPRARARMSVRARPESARQQRTSGPVSNHAKEGLASSSAYPSVGLLAFVKCQCDIE